jgi:hypothetical protein
MIDELRKMFYMFSKSIDSEILVKSEMRFEKDFKSYSKNE